MSDGRRQLRLDLAPTPRPPYDGAKHYYVLPHPLTTREAPCATCGRGADDRSAHLRPAGARL